MVGGIDSIDMVGGVITIDHIFSISAALVGGIIWDTMGFQYVFLFGALLAAINFFVASRVRVPAGDIDLPQAV